MESGDVMISVLNAGYEPVNGVYIKTGPSWSRRTEDGAEFIITMDVIPERGQALCLYELSGSDKILRYVDYMEHGRIGGVEDLTLEVADAAEPVPQVLLINTYQEMEDELKASEDAQLAAMSGGGATLAAPRADRALRSSSATRWTDDDLMQLQEGMMAEMTRINKMNISRQVDAQDSLRWDKTEAQIAQDQRETAKENLTWKIQQRPDANELVERGVIAPELREVVKGGKEYEDAVESEHKRQDEVRTTFSVEFLRARQTREEFRERTDAVGDKLTWKFGQRAELADLIARGIVPPELASIVKGDQDYDGANVMKERQEQNKQKLAERFVPQSPTEGSAET